MEKPYENELAFVGIRFCQVKLKKTQTISKIHKFPAYILRNVTTCCIQKKIKRIKYSYMRAETVTTKLKLTAIAFM
jgi:hypothetical protein